MWTPGRALRICGVVICGLSAVFSVLELLGAHPPDRAAGCLLEVAARSLGLTYVPIAALETSAFLLFTALFWKSTGKQLLSRASRKALPLLGAQAAVGLLGAQAAVGLLVAPELLGLVSFLSPLLLVRVTARRLLALVVVLQPAAYFTQMQLTGSHPLAKLMPGWGALSTMAMVGATAAVWHCLAFSFGLFAVAERERARELARINAELTATRLLESETARVAVRLGISRDLHDASGHHLAALNVNLRLMRRLEDPAEVRQKIDECLFVVGQLLREVRDVVKDLRSVQRIDLHAILKTVCGGFEGLAVHLDIDPDLARAEPYYAHTIFRCVQEILTNTAKHAEARNAWLTLTRTPGGYRIEGRDDGKGMSDFHYGTGLTGMRERVAEFGGEFEVQSRAGEGFAVRLYIPVRRATA